MRQRKLSLPRVWAFLALTLLGGLGVIPYSLIADVNQHFKRAAVIDSLLFH